MSDIIGTQYVGLGIGFPSTVVEALSGVEGDPLPIVGERLLGGGVQVTAGGQAVALGGVASALIQSIDIATINAIDSPPLLALDNWTTGQTVRAGYSVNASGRKYTYTASGVTGATAPTHAGLNANADGTAFALYDGPVRAPVSGKAPTITHVARPASFSKRHNPLTQPEKFIFSGGAVIPVANGIQIAGYSTKDAGSIVTTVPGKSNNNPAVEFITDAPVFFFNDTVSTSSPSYRFIIEVNGRRLKDSAIMGSGAGPGMRVDLSAYPVEPCRVRIYWQQSVAVYSFEGIWTQAGYNVWAPEKGLSAAIIGTSLTSGSGYSAFVSGLGWFDYFASACGFKAAHNLAQGSSGMQVERANRFSWLERIQDVLDAAPDVLFIEGPHNDVPYSDASQLAANISYIQQIRAALPETFIVCFGTNAELLSRSAGMLATETNMAQAVRQVADPMVIFVPVMQDPQGPWFFGYRQSGILAMTIGPNAQFTYSAPPLCAVGDRVVPRGLVGSEAVNGLIGHVTAVAGNVVTTDINTTGAGALTNNTGYLQVNDVWTSQDGVHTAQYGIPWLANRYRDALYRKLKSIAG